MSVGVVIVSYKCRELLLDASSRSRRTRGAACGDGGGSTRFGLTEARGCARGVPVRCWKRVAPGVRRGGEDGFGRFRRLTWCAS